MPSLTFLTSIIALLIGLVGCGFETADPARDGAVRLRLNLLPIGALSKSSAIELRTLDLSIHQGADTAIRASLDITTKTRTLNPIYVLPAGHWVAVARVSDVMGQIVYLDSVAFILHPADTTFDVHLSLRPRFSEFALRISPIDTSKVGKVTLSLQGSTLGTRILAETDFTRMGKDSTVSLAFDHIPTGESLFIRIDVQDKSFQILSQWSGSLYVIPGQDTSLRILLKAVGTPVTTGISLTPIATIGIRAEVPTADPRPFLNLVKSGSQIRGQIRNLAGNLTGFRVALVRFAGGGWYSHPTYAQPYVDINAEGFFLTEFASDSLKAFLVPLAYPIPPASGSIPTGLEAAAVATGYYP